MNLDALRIALESTDGQIAFYRRRAGQVFFFGVLAEALVAAGVHPIELPETWSVAARRGTLSTMYIAIAAVGTILAWEYRTRIRNLKKDRHTLLEALPTGTIKLNRPEGSFSELVVLFWVLWTLSIAGVLLALFGEISGK